ncbi:MAG TPA: D-lyxose/D-mannose family sugar isomerase [Rectinemataceae bacterium]|nr:D-lyxose/D-mannose family sugar isomerase [Rectinemataceae bacterium]
MKRSEINARIEAAESYFAAMNFKLPPWAFRSPADWKGRYAVDSEIVDNALGWDLTDFGEGKFARRGLLLFTIRNGRLGADRKSYAEKIMIVEEDQETPFHFHWSKMEDIIDRGGGNLVLELYRSAEDESLSVEDVEVRVDGELRRVEAGARIVLEPGQSICLEQGVYHRFYGEHGKGRVLVGEVSAVNDDQADNRFLESLGRFPKIEEDEPPRRLLISDYRSYV